jgi:hypothetical protein
MTGRSLIAMFIALVALAACSKSQTPEAQVRATIAQAETAAEKREVGALRGLVSEKYADSQGQDKRAIEAVLRFYFLRNESIHLFTHVRSVGFPEKDRALAVVLVAMAAQPVKRAEELERLRANLYRFEFRFAREGDQWRVVSAEWRPAEFIEFL